MTQVEEDKVYELFDDIDFDLLIKWADILGVKHHEDEWSKAEWTDLESELRQEVSNTMIGLLSKEDIGPWPLHEEYKRRVLGEFVPEPNIKSC